MEISITVDPKSRIKCCLMGARMLEQWIQMINSSVQTNKQKKINIVITTQEHYQFSKISDQLVIQVVGTHMHHAHLLSLSGHLGTFGQDPLEPFFPQYLVDMVTAIGIGLLALPILLKWNNKGQSIKKEISCLDCLKYFGAFNISALHNGLINQDKQRGQNVLDGGAPFYKIFKCANNTWLTVGNIQFKFYQEMIEEMNLKEEDKQFCLENHMNMDEWAKIDTIFTEKFKEKTAQQWENSMINRDTCIVAVKPINKENKNYLHPKFLRPKL